VGGNEEILTSQEDVCEKYSQSGVVDEGVNLEGRKIS